MPRFRGSIKTSREARACRSSSGRGSRTLSLRITGRHTITDAGSINSKREIVRRRHEESLMPDTAKSSLPKKWVGRSLRRTEAKRLLTGKGQFLDDMKLPGMYHDAVLRSPYPHAIIKSGDGSGALKMPGVRGVLTGEDVAQMCSPFPQAVDEPLEYYCIAVDPAPL